MSDDFLFIIHGYDADLAPCLTVHKSNSNNFEHIALRNKALTLVLDKSKRYCTGWHDLATAKSSPCPDSTELPEKFSQCRHCQNKTGFNPAFYNASSVSPQQQARNAQPHFLYLAHFAPGVVKVGISWANRGLRRLLDQGARSCLVIKTYPTATVARQYEAKISSLPGIAETLQAKTKQAFFAQTYDEKVGAKELIAARQRLINECGITPETNEPQFLDSHYLADACLNKPIMLDAPKISGRCLGMIGSTIICIQNEQQFGLCVSGLAGYRLKISDVEELNEHKPQQASLF